MGILDRFKKARENNKLYKQLKDAPQEELLKAIETNPESYDVVIKALRKRALKLRIEWKNANDLFWGSEKKQNYVLKKGDEFRSLVSKCFSAIIERAPEYITEVDKFKRRFDNHNLILLSANALISIPPFEANNSPLLKLVSENTYAEYLCGALQKDKTLAPKAFEFLTNSDKGTYFINTPIAQTILEVSPDMADKFLLLLSNGKFDKTRYGIEQIAHSIEKAKPELTSEVLKLGYGKDGAAKENPQSYLEYISEHQEKIISAGRECYNLLTMITRQPELKDKCIGLLKSLPTEEKQKINEELSYILSVKYQSYYKKHTYVPEAFFTLVQADNSYLKFTDPENISLKLINAIANDHPQMRDDINQFIIDKFCKEDSINATHCNDLVIMSKALNEMFKSGNISYEDGLKYANKITAIEPQYIKEEPDWYPMMDESEDGGWEQGCWQGEHKANIEHNKSNKKALEVNIGKIYSCLGKKQPNKDKVIDGSSEKNADTSEFITSKISLLRAVVAPNVSKEKGEVNPKMSVEEKKARLSAANIKIKGITD